MSAHLNSDVGIRRDLPPNADDLAECAADVEALADRLYAAAARMHDRATGRVDALDLHYAMAAIRTLKPAVKEVEDAA